MAVAQAYGGAARATDVVTTSGEVLSLLFIVASFIIVLYLAARVRTRRSFQFEMFVFALVLGAAEIPKILLDLSGIDMGVLVTYGLEVHSVSMIILASFVAYRIYGFFRGETVAVK